MPIISGIYVRYDILCMGSYHSQGPLCDVKEYFINHGRRLFIRQETLDSYHALQTADAHMVSFTRRRNITNLKSSGRRFDQSILTLMKTLTQRKMVCHFMYYSLCNIYVYFEIFD